MTARVVNIAPNVRRGPAKRRSPQRESDEGGSGYRERTPDENILTAAAAPAVRALRYPFHPLPIPIRWQPVMELQIRRHYMPLGNL